MFTASHNPAQYNGIKLCLSRAKPVGAGHRPRGDQGDGRGRRRRRPRRARARAPSSTSSTPTPTTSAPSSTPSVLTPAEDRRRHRQRHGRAGRAGGVRRACRSTSRSSTPSSTARSRTTPPIRSTRRTRSTSRRGCSRSAPTSGSPSTATPIACSSSTRGARAVGLDHHGDRGRRRPGQGAGGDHPAQLHLLQGGARGRPRARRHPDPHPGRPQLHQAGDGRDRRRLRRRALGPLLLPRELPGRLRLHRRPRRRSSSWRSSGEPLPELRSPFERYAASGEINFEVARPRRP